MLFHSRLPAAPLRRVVEYLWYLDCEPSHDHSQARIIPSGRAELVFDLRDESARPIESTVIGPHSEYSILLALITVLR